MKRAIIDFETYYSKKDKISVVDLGIPNYVQSTDAYIVAVLVDGEMHCGTIQEMQPLMRALASDPSIEPWAAHSNFDQGWWEKYAPSFPQPWQCALDLGVFHQLPRNLAGITKTLFGVKMDKAIRTEMNGVDFFALPSVEREKVIEYCMDDVEWTAKAIETLPPMSPTEHRIAMLTRLQNRRGIRVDVDLLDSDKAALEQARFEALKLIPWAAGGANKPLSYPALADWCLMKGIPVPESIAKTDEECAELMSDHPALKEIIGYMRTFRRATTLLRKAELLEDRLDGDTMPMDLLFAGAPHTRRWSCKGFNVQNLDKEPVSFVEGVRPVWTRNWLVPREGKKFVILDYAQIEPRCLNWLAGNTELLDAIRSGFSYYEAYARLYKGWKGAAGTLKKEYGKERYTKLKNEALGLGYGMGAKKYTTYANVSSAEATQVVDAFRKNNRSITKFWRQMDALINRAGNPTVTNFDGTRHLEIEMPSGDLLQYFKVRSNNRNGYEGYVVKGDFGPQSRQGSLWGGTLTENVTQRMARDVLAAGMLRLEDAGLPVVFHAHDEVVVEADESCTQEALLEAEHLLTIPPDWAPDLPLEVEGGVVDRYTKL